MLRLGCIVVVGALILGPYAWAQPAPGPPPPGANPAPPPGPLGPGGPSAAAPPPGPRNGQPPAPGEPGAPPPPPGSPAAPPPGGPGAPGVQPAPDQPADPNATPDASSIVPVPPPLPDMPKGDVITLKTGKVLKNVQVVKATLTEVHVQTLLNPSEELPPLVVPRKYVQSIEYDDYDPNQAALAQKNPQQEPGITSGFAVSKDLGEKLRSKIPPPPLSFQDQDLIDVLQTLSERTGITINVSDGVRAIPQPQRRWTFQSTDDVTLFLLFQEKLPEKFPNLVVEYQFDRVLVRVESEGAPAAGTPAEAPETPDATEGGGAASPS